MIADRDPALKPPEAREPGSQDADFRLQKVSKVMCPLPVLLRPAQGHSNHGSGQVNDIQDDR